MSNGRYYVIHHKDRPMEFEFPAWLTPYDTWDSLDEAAIHKEKYVPLAAEEEWVSLDVWATHHE